MTVTPRRDSSLRLVVFFVAAHSLLTLILLRLDSDLVVVLLAPLALLVPFVFGSHSLSFSPFALVLRVAFASAVWALVLYGLYLLVRRFVRYRPGLRLVRLGRTITLLFAVADLSYLLFGPLVGFAGDRIFGVLEPIRYLQGKYHVDPLWFAISALAWTAGLFGAYRYLVVTPTTRELTRTA